MSLSTKISYLEPIANQKNFNNKAIVLDKGKIKELLSYDEVVVIYDLNNNTLSFNGTYSATTKRHIIAFAFICGFNEPTTNEIKNKITLTR